MYYNQEEYRIKFEWGLDGIHTLYPVSDIIVIVDVLSFSTCVDIVTSNGAIVYPYQWKDKTALNYARKQNAILADSNRNRESSYTLSPRSLLDISSNEKIVLPSPNGSTLSLSTENRLTVCGCLRNAKSVADFCRLRGERITVIAAGERWSATGNMRVAQEDLLGAGAILSHLGSNLSPEAESARNIYECSKSELFTIISKLSSGKELIGRGFAEDIKIASQLNVSDSVPVLLNKAYINEKDI
ncbi:MAG: 2-phosphosulfolactate phosphatase [Saprospiraceae bacterium]|nr:2-phosphosulfolactate phosphatase [Saprospiraceae bacterium]